MQIFIAAKNDPQSIATTSVKRMTKKALPNLFALTAVISMLDEIIVTDKRAVKR